MAKFLIEASYTGEGLKGLKKDTAVGRKAAIAKMAKGLGGKLDSMHFALGEHDVYVVFDLPDTVSAASAALAASSSGLVRTKTTALLTPEEIDEAFAKKVSYKAPGET
ncbi:Uncharacterized protein, contains GYD domain [Rhizobiales bacterium GAS191]|nr:Uncharacterized protein, contains GYD domain [Rhizobiales bacterium GAS113]SEB89070.1 Uncharacterized protein, contains GYD domain [Rhizobiales bacterium GAS191]